LCTNKTQFHTTQPSRDDVVKKLEEFFDNPKNFGENEVKHGRSWTTDELRIKSSKDLHQLWYVLLKEKNMLLTMEHECKDKCHLFPSPERLDKVGY
jgi:large subunit ribosomal protein L47